MNCESCGRPAVLLVGPPNGQIPLCIDCNLKLAQASAIRHEMITSARDDIWARGAAATGLQNPRPPRNQTQGLRLGDTTFNNITIKDSTVGVVNTGYIGTVDSAISVLEDSGDKAAADALRKLSEEVANATQISAQVKNDVLELLSVLAAEAAAPKEQRRSRAMLAMAESLATLLEGAAALSDLSTRYLPLIRGLFQ